MKRKYLIIPVLCLSFFAFAAHGAKKPVNASSMVNSEGIGNGADRNMDTEKMMDNETIMEAREVEMMNDTKKMNQRDPAPDFEMIDLNGNMVKLSDFAGEKVYIKYWASWCPICLGGLEDINTLSAENNGFKVLTIVTPGSKGEKNEEDFKAWFADVEHTENITVLLDIAGVYTSKAGVRGFPTSEYIGSDGTLINLAPGHADNETIKSTFEAIN